MAFAFQNDNDDDGDDSATVNIIQLIFVEGLLNTKLDARCFTCATLLNPHNNYTKHYCYSHFTDEGTKRSYESMVIIHKEKE